MPKKPLPTGEEPPKGFEYLAETRPANNDLRIDYVFVSQLAKVELSEINIMRELAFSNVQTLTGLSDALIPFEEEIAFLPGTPVSDKIIFRAYKGSVLVGYALVVIGWPEQGDWVIQHLVINPNYRLQGIGSGIVWQIENFALKSEVDANRIFAIPLESRGVEFWQRLSYGVEDTKRIIKLTDGVRELNVYRKEL